MYTELVTPELRRVFLKLFSNYLLLRGTTINSPHRLLKINVNFDALRRRGRHFDQHSLSAEQVLSKSMSKSMSTSTSMYM